VDAIWAALRSLTVALTATVQLVLPTHHGQPVPVTAPMPRVEIFGDSVTWESEPYISQDLAHRATVNFHVFGGTSVCRWFDIMRQVAATKPTMVLITFQAWKDQPCDHTTDPYRELQDDAGTAADIFSGSHVVFASDPPAKGFTEQARVDAAYLAAADAHPNAEFNPAVSRSVAPDNTFTPYLPCLPDESAARGCDVTHGRVIKVRAPDGEHLCPVIGPVPGPHCPLYSSGQRRFSDALTAPAAALYPVRSA
jgi:hypothetical protein